jgi:hypothetical protein
MTIPMTIPMTIQKTGRHAEPIRPIEMETH